MDAVEIFTALGTPGGRADPYPYYAALHDLGEAVVLSPGSVAVVGHDAVSSVLRDPGFRCQDEEMFDQSFPGWRAHPGPGPGGGLDPHPERREAREDPQSHRPCVYRPPGCRARAGHHGDGR